MTSTIGDLQRQVEEFGEEMAELLKLTLPGMPDPIVDTQHKESRYVIRAGNDQRGVPLFVSGQKIATLVASVKCRLDSVDRYLAVEHSTYSVLAEVDRTPIIRYEYQRDMSVAPNAHVHVHAHRGALSHLLSRTGHSAPHDMSKLHIPLGGSRFRPCLEDLIQFLIQECRFDSRAGWKERVEVGRERWRRFQMAAVTRDVPDEAARVLQELGYQVTPPVGQPPTSSNALRHW